MTARPALVALSLVLAALPALAQQQSAAPRTSSTGTAATAPAPAELPTTPAGAAATAAPPRMLPPEGEAKKPDPKAQAEQQKRELDAAMDRVAERWRKRAAAEGWQTHSATPTGP